ncbi:hypothetical protein CORC01_00868 [Colletotrichum orchidophilum]|uniref:Uncharacterized protein n=1 Tax=Colletotrichum orchidophilum TaxID=1209926 RepID=A0A1G4BRT2_9PEZI|nr:uncharacterized protein CORC01_00868 [Colletotrichum orchidophilum]OHF04006.1 hypothetical protein CORC01_00868 [Colletotrichum orchidophilum]
MPSIFSLVLASLMVSPILSSISSPAYLPFELEKRDGCGDSYCNCHRAQCILDFCFDDHVDPWILVDSAMYKYYGVDCGQFDWWARYDPAQWCNNGLRKARALFYINRRFGSTGDTFNIKYSNDNATDPHRGSVSGTCHPVGSVKCDCHSKYNSTLHDCSSTCS